MITCPKCGAGNKPGTTACRMCAAPLDASNQADKQGSKQINSLPPTIMFSNQQTRQTVPEATEGVACPTCGTMNEAGWAFCQQCGSKLNQPSAQPPAGGQKPAQGQQTIVAHMPALDPNAGGQGQQATVIQPPPQRPPAPQPPQQSAPPKSAPPKSAPPKSAPPKPSAPPVEQRPAQGQQTVVAQPPPPAEQRYNPPPAANQSSAMTEHVQSASAEKGAGGSPCVQCGHMNNFGSAFCSSCGAPIPVAKTIVMSSVPAPIKARLHLVMEGGQQGEVFDVKSETIIGRVQGDITFPHDGFMSGRHARIVQRGDSFVLMDESSRNGTFIRIKNEVELKPGDMILIGKQLFRFEV